MKPTVLPLASALLGITTFARAAPAGAPPFALEASFQGQNPLGGVPPDRFGASVSMDIDTLAVGVPGRFGDDSQEVGSVLLFARTAGAWTQTQLLRAPSDGLDRDRFGAAVSKFAGYVAVGTAPQSGGTRGAYVFESGPGGFGLAAHLMPPAGEPSGGFGRAVSIAGGDTGGWLAVGAPENRAVYLYERVAGTWTYRQKVVAGDVDGNATFGASVEIDHLLDVLAVGSPGQDSPGAADSGAVYVFRRSGSTWTQEAKLTAPDAASGDALGASVSMWEGTLVAGAPEDDAPGAADRGSACVFVYAAGAWGFQQSLVPPGGSAGDGFGTAVSVSYDTAVAGAPGANGGTGAAYPFTRAAGTWSAGTPFTAGRADANDAFGAAVTVFEDRAVVGAPERIEAGTGPAGAAYAFLEAGRAWDEEGTIVPDHGAESMLFGRDVAIEGDTLAVGASGMNVPAGRAAGGVFAFTRQTAGWTAPQRLAAADGAEDDQLGWSVAISGDALIVGANWKDLGGAGDQGAAYVFRRTSGLWSEEARLVAPDAGVADIFGTDVAISGDTAVVGAPLDGTGPIVQHGSLYVFVRSGAVWTLQQKLTASDAASSAHLGISVSIVGDTIVAGAHGDQSARGAVYVFRRTGAVWNELTKLLAADGVASDFLGYSVSLAGNTLAAGAPQASPAGTFSGAIYVFTEGPGGWSPEQKLVPVNATANSRAGGVIALSGERLVSSTSAGAVNIFERMGRTWTQQADLPGPSGVKSFGYSVAASGTVVVAGAWADSTSSGSFAGTAHVYRKALADLTASIDDGQVSAVPGATVAYSIVVRNVGPDPVVGARVTTPAPFLLTDVGWTCIPSPGAACGPSGSGALDDLASLPAGTFATYALSGTIPANLTGTLTTYARITAPAGVADPNTANDLAQDVDVLTVRTDLAVALTSTPTAVGSGALVTWTTDVTNFGPSVSSGSVLVHDLAAHATVVSVDPPPPACVATVGNVTCAFGTTAPGAPRRLTVVQRVDPDYLGPLFAQSTVTASETDPVAANNQDQLEIEVIPPGDAEIAHGTSMIVPMPAGGTLYRIGQRPYASYETVVDATSGDIGIGAGPSLRLETVSSTVLESLPVGTGSSRSLRWRNDSSAVVDDQYVRVVSQGCTTDCGAEDVFRLRVYETTLYGPRFNNTGGQGTVLVLQTSGAAPVSGRAHFWSAGGALLATAPFDLAPRGSMALATATVAGLADQSGTLTVSHDGAYGAVTGKTVALVPETGASFDTPLSYRGR